MKDYSVKQLVSNNNQAHFIHYKKGELWYKIVCVNCQVIKEKDVSLNANLCCDFEFPVPVDDCGDGEFQNVERAMLLMRYIRKHISNIKEGQLECG